MTTPTPGSEREKGDGVTRTEHRRPTFQPGVWKMPRKMFNALWVLIAVLGLFILAGADLTAWILGKVREVATVNVLGRGLPA